MILLTTAAHPTIMDYRESDAGAHLGRLLMPRSYGNARSTALAGVPWAADNDAFGGWDEDKATRFVGMLETIRGLPGCLFVTAPDVVGDAGLTDLLFDEWAPQILARNLPVAYVLQESGTEREPTGVPWGSLDALFVGGADDEFKTGPRVEAVIREAKRRRKWVHMGRVNTPRRAAYAKAIGCDSFDGSSFSRWRSIYLRTGLAWASAGPQLILGEPS